MRLAKRLLTALCAAMALAAGFLAAVIAIAGIALFMVLRLFGASKGRGHLDGATRTPTRNRRTRTPDPEAIDVSATEVTAVESVPDEAPR